MAEQSVGQPADVRTAEWAPDPTRTIRPPGRPRRHLWLPITLGVLVAALAGALAVVLVTRPGRQPAQTASVVTVQGDFTLRAMDSVSGGPNNCYGIDGYDDIASGAQVTISDPSGKVVALTRLGNGTLTGLGCRFDFTVTAPAGLAFYGISVSHRGTLQFTPQDVATGNVHLGIG